MDRLQKKCFIASSGMHGVLLLVVVFGTAFFAPEKLPPVESFTMVPTKLLDGVLSGGGGNPNIPRTEAKIQGETLNPVPPQPVKPQPKPVEPPKPKTEVKPVEPKAAPPKVPAIELKPVKPSVDRAKAKAEADAKTRAEAKAKQQQLAKAMSKIRENMRQGFSSGTAVEVSGPGGEAYASYRSFVFAAYDNAWQVLPDITNEDSVVVARVIIHRTGRIISAEISQRSGNPALDKSVRRALDSVTSLPPFPSATRDQERTFVIEFSLKAKRLIG